MRRAFDAIPLGRPPSGPPFPGPSASSTLADAVASPARTFLGEETEQRSYGHHKSDPERLTEGVHARYHRRTRRESPSSDWATSGLPLALALARRYSVTGLDLERERVAELAQGT